MDSIITKQAAKVVSVNGNPHVKINGQEVPVAELAELTSGTELILPLGAGALLQLEDGSLIPVGEMESNIASTDEFSVDDEIAAIQELLLNEDFDPTQELEATAAGNTASGSGSWGFQAIGREGAATIAQAGFDSEATARDFATTRILREETDTPAAVTNDADIESTATFTLSSTTAGNDIVEGGQITYTVTLGAVADENITVTLSNGQTIFIEAGELSGSVDVNVRADDLYTQNDDDISVSIESVSENNFDQIELVGTVTNKVVDDNDAPTLTLTGDTTVTEGESANYTLSLSDAPTETMTVIVVVGHKTTEDGDIIPVEKTFTFEPGQTEVSFTIDTLDDALIETTDEDVLSVTVTGATNGGFEKAPELPPVFETSINDEDGTNPDNDREEDITVKIEATDNRAIEGDAGDTVTFTVSRSVDNGFDTTVKLSLVDSDAETLFNAGDILSVKIGDTLYEGDALKALFTAPGVDITFNDTTGNSIDVVITPNDDALLENTENFTGTITAVDGGNGTIDNGSADASFSDEPGSDDNKREEDLTVQIETVTGKGTAAESQDESVQFVISRSDNNGKDTTVKFTLGSDAAIDFTADDIKSITINGGEPLSKAQVEALLNGTGIELVLSGDSSDIVVTITPNDDKLLENTEAFTGNIEVIADSNGLVNGSVETGKGSADGAFTDKKADDEVTNEDLLVKIETAENKGAAAESQDESVQFVISRSDNNGEDTTVKFTLGSDAAIDFTADDIKSITINGGEPLSKAQVEALLNGTGIELVLSGDSSDIVVTITPNDDKLLENTEAFTGNIEVIADSNGLVNGSVETGKGSADGAFTDKKTDDEVTNEDLLVKIETVTGKGTAAESQDESVQFVISRSDNNGEDTTVKFTLGSAADVDFTADDIKSITINGGEPLSKAQVEALLNGTGIELTLTGDNSDLTVTITPNDDKLLENTEAFTGHITVIADSNGLVNGAIAKDDAEQPLDSADGQFTDKKTDDEVTNEDLLVKIETAENKGAAAESQDESVQFVISRSDNNGEDTTVKFTLGSAADVDFTADDIKSITINGGEPLSKAQVEALLNGTGIELTLTGDNSDLTVTITPNDDKLLENTEAFTGNIEVIADGNGLVNGSVETGKGSADGAFTDKKADDEVTNEDLLVKIETAENKGAAAESQDESVQFTISRSDNNGEDTTVKFTLGSDAAIDFTADDIKSITINGGEPLSKAQVEALLNGTGIELVLSGDSSDIVVTITPNDDKLLENTEAFTGNIEVIADSNGLVNGSVETGKGSADGAFTDKKADDEVTNEDLLVKIETVSGKGAAAESQDESVQFVISRSDNNGKDTTVKFTLGSDAAIDFTADDIKSITINGGEPLSKAQVEALLNGTGIELTLTGDNSDLTVTITPNDDKLLENTEAFTGNIEVIADSNGLVNGSVETGKGSADGAFTDKKTDDEVTNEDLLVKIETAENKGAAAESQDESVQFVISRSDNNGEDTTVKFTLGSDAAIDFTADDIKSITINGGEPLSKAQVEALLNGSGIELVLSGDSSDIVVTITPNDDKLLENTEAFTGNIEVIADSNGLVNGSVETGKGSADGAFTDKKADDEVTNEDLLVKIETAENKGAAAESQDESVQFVISRSDNNGEDTTVKFTLGSDAAIDFTADDIASITIGDKTLTTDEIADLLNGNGVNVVLSGDTLSTTVTITPNDDKLLENTEAFTGNIEVIADGNGLVNGSVETGKGSADGAFTDKKADDEVTNEDLLVKIETVSGKGAAAESQDESVQFVISRSDNNGKDTTVKFTLGSDAAIDFTADDIKSITINGGEPLSKAQVEALLNGTGIELVLSGDSSDIVVTITPNDDKLLENTEAFTGNIEVIADSNGLVNGSVETGKGSADGAFTDKKTDDEVTNEDLLVKIETAENKGAAAESQDESVQFTISRSDDNGEDTTVKFTLGSDAAIDFTADDIASITIGDKTLTTDEIADLLNGNGVNVVLSGDTLSTTVTITPNDDKLLENTEAFTGNIEVIADGNGLVNGSVETGKGSADGAFTDKKVDDEVTNEDLLVKIETAENKGAAAESQDESVQFVISRSDNNGEDTTVKFTLGSDAAIDFTVDDIKSITINGGEPLSKAQVEALLNGTGIELVLSGDSSDIVVTITPNDDKLLENTEAFTGNIEVIADSNGLVNGSVETGKGSADGAFTDKKTDDEVTNEDLLVKIETAENKGAAAESQDESVQFVISRSDNNGKDTTVKFTLGSDAAIDFTADDIKSITINGGEPLSKAQVEALLNGTGIELVLSGDSSDIVVTITPNDDKLLENTEAFTGNIEVIADSNGLVNGSVETGKGSADGAFTDKKADDEVTNEDLLVKIETVSGKGAAAESQDESVQFVISRSDNNGKDTTVKFTLGSDAAIDFTADDIKSITIGDKTLTTDEIADLLNGNGVNVVLSGDTLSTTVTITPNDDKLLENTEAFTGNIEVIADGNGLVNGSVETGKGSADGAFTDKKADDEVTNEDLLVKIETAENKGAAAESQDESVQFVISRSDNNGEDTTVKFTLGSDAAIDFTADDIKSITIGDKTLTTDEIADLLNGNGVNVVLSGDTLSTTVTITPNDDKLLENTEAFTGNIEVIADSNGLVNGSVETGKGSADGAFTDKKTDDEVTNEDLLVKIETAENKGAAAESQDESVQFVISRSDNNGEDTTVKFTLGSAADVDFTADDIKSITINGGEPLSKAQVEALLNGTGIELTLTGDNSDLTVTITPNDDKLLENTEAFTGHITVIADSNGLVNGSVETGKGSADGAFTDKKTDDEVTNEDLLVKIETVTGKGTAAESQSESVQFVISRSDNNGEDTTVKFTLGSDAAIDFTVDDIKSITINGGEPLSKAQVEALLNGTGIELVLSGDSSDIVVTITPNDDKLLENTEAFTGNIEVIADSNGLVNGSVETGKGSADGAFTDKKADDEVTNEDLLVKIETVSGKGAAAESQDESVQFVISRSDNNGKDTTVKFTLGSDAAINFTADDIKSITINGGEPLSKAQVEALLNGTGIELTLTGDNSDLTVTITPNDDKLLENTEAFTGNIEVIADGNGLVNGSVETGKGSADGAFTDKKADDEVTNEDLLVKIETAENKGTAAESQSESVQFVISRSDNNGEDTTVKFTLGSDAAIDFTVDDIKSITINGGEPLSKAQVEALLNGTGIELVLSGDSSDIVVTITPNDDKLLENTEAFTGNIEVIADSNGLVNGSVETGKGSADGAFTDKKADDEVTNEDLLVKIETVSGKGAAAESQDESVQFVISRSDNNGKDTTVKFTLGSDAAINFTADDIKSITINGGEPLSKAQVEALLNGTGIELTLTGDNSDLTVTITPNDDKLLENTEAFTGNIEVIADGNGLVNGSVETGKGSADGAFTDKKADDEVTNEDLLVKIETAENKGAAAESQDESVQFVISRSDNNGEDTTVKFTLGSDAAIDFTVDDIKSITINGGEPLSKAQVEALLNGTGIELVLSGDSSDIVVTITPNDDKLLENTEAFTGNIEVIADSNGLVNGSVETGKGSADGAFTDKKTDDEVTNEDLLVKIETAENKGAAAESQDESVQFVISRSDNNGKDTTVKFTLGSDAAIDFTADDIKSITINGGEPLSKAQVEALLNGTGIELVLSGDSSDIVVTITPNDDKLLENTEAFTGNIEVIADSNGLVNGSVETGKGSADGAFTDKKTDDEVTNEDLLVKIETAENKGAAAESQDESVQFVISRSDNNGEDTTVKFTLGSDAAIDFTADDIKSITINGGEPLSKAQVEALLNGTGIELVLSGDSSDIVVTITPNDDKLLENTEAFTGNIEVIADSNGLVNGSVETGKGSADGAFTDKKADDEVTNEDLLVKIETAENKGAAAESQDESVQFVISRSDNNGEDTTVKFTLGSDAAIDFTADDIKSITINGGEPLSKAQVEALLNGTGIELVLSGDSSDIVVTITPNDDKLLENTEAFTGNIEVIADSNGLVNGSVETGKGSADGAFTDKKTDDEVTNEDLLVKIETVTGKGTAAESQSESVQFVISRSDNNGEDTTVKFTLGSDAAIDFTVDDIKSITINGGEPLSKAQVEALLNGTGIELVLSGDSSDIVVTITPNDDKLLENTEAFTGNIEVIADSNGLVNGSVETGKGSADGAFTDKKTDDEVTNEDLLVKIETVTGKGTAAESQDESVQFVISRSDNNGEDTTVKFTLGSDAAIDFTVDDIKSITINGGEPLSKAQVEALLNGTGIELVLSGDSSDIVVTITPNDDKLLENTEAFTGNIEVIADSNGLVNGSVETGKGSADGAFTDKKTDDEVTNEDLLVKIETVTGKGTAAESQDESVQFVISRSDNNGEDTTVKFTLGSDAAINFTADDIKSITINGGEPLSKAQVEALLNGTGIELTLTGDNSDLTVTITPNDDKLLENTEAFTGNIEVIADSNGLVNGSVETGKGSADGAFTDKKTDDEVTNEDLLVKIETAENKGAAAESQDESVQFVISRSDNNGEDTTVKFTLGSDAAIDFTVDDIKSITINGGEPLSKAQVEALLNGTGIELVLSGDSSDILVTITPNDDKLLENTEAFTGNIEVIADSNGLVNGSVETGKGSADGAFTDKKTDDEVTNEDITVKIEATDNRAIEGDAGDTVTFTVSRSVDNGFDTTVKFSLADSDAETLFNAGDILSVKIGDTLYEGDALKALFTAPGVDITFNDTTGNSIDVVITPKDDALLENTENFTGTITAVDGGNGTIDTDNGADTASVKDNDKLVITVKDAIVTEEGLSNGNPDNTGEPSDSATDTTANSIEIDINVEDYNDVNVSFTLDGEGNPTFEGGHPDLSSGDEPINWTVDGSSLIGYKGDDESDIVVTVTLEQGSDTAKPSYSVTLHQPLDHSDKGVEDIQGLQPNITVEGKGELAGIDAGQSHLDISIEDDMPVIDQSSQPVIPSGTEKSNVQLILDVSGSMSSRIQLLETAILAMLKQYEAAGTVKVQMLLFNTSTEVVETDNGDTWMTVAQAKDIIESNMFEDIVSQNYATYYDKAISKSTSSWMDPGKIEDAKNTTYFVSDGQPTDNHEFKNSAEWHQHLEDNNIRSEAIGITNNLLESDLNGISHDGQNNTTLDPILVGDVTDLFPIFNQLAASAVKGQLFTDQSFGADGKGSVTLTIDSTDYTFNFDKDGKPTLEGDYDDLSFSEGKLTIVVDGKHTLIVDINTGGYVFHPSFTTENQSIEIGVQLTDGDGDSASATHTFDVAGLPSLDVTDSNNDDLGDNTVLENNGSTDAGEFTFTADAGFKSITIGNQTFTSIVELQNNVEITFEGVTFKIEQVTDNNGVITVNYTVVSIESKDHSSHNSNSNADAGVIVDLPIVIVDQNNISVTDSIYVNIADTAPKAVDDNVTTDEDTKIVGNVISGDTDGIGQDQLGADSTAVMRIQALVQKGSSNTFKNKWFDVPQDGSNLTVESKYGTLIINKFGEYTFTPNEEANKLNDGDIEKQNFKYELKDSDGDTDTANLDIAINGVTDFDNVIIDKLGGINSVYLSDGFVTSSPGHTTPSGETPSVTVNGVVMPGANIPVTDGNDYVDTGTENDHVEGGKGNDVIYLGSGSIHLPDNIIPMDSNGSPIAAQFVTLSDKDIFQNGKESNTLGKFQSPTWADAAHGADGNDKIFGQEDVDLISGGKGNDYLDGGSGTDFIRGGSDNDIIIGGAGDDLMRGDGGKDTFSWDLSHVDADTVTTDTIVDFNLKDDVLDLGDLLSAPNAGYAIDAEWTGSWDDLSKQSLTIKIDIDGDASGENGYEQLITLENITGNIRDGIVINTLVDGKEATLTIQDSDGYFGSTPPSIVIDVDNN
ncbi:immunoglobulin-like domain-containing protein [Enterovibrio sp. 27052020O]|uniref:immunoglobulin-like domain-containing protein n=1 Tax=Enterovibrio sp. 27052020O TaxID=3241166 RepID=UPI00388F7116